MHHWGEAFLAQDDRRDEAVVLIDPDFLFLTRFELPPDAPPVLPGKPAAAKYGLGGQVRRRPLATFRLRTRSFDAKPPLIVA